jgi:hypothetical protein
MTSAAIERSFRQAGGLKPRGWRDNQTKSMKDKFMKGDSTAI